MKKFIFICLLICLVGFLFNSFKNKPQNIETKKNSSDNTYSTTTTISRRECLEKFGTWNEDKKICALRNKH